MSLEYETRWYDWEDKKKEKQREIEFVAEQRKFSKSLDRELDVHLIELQQEYKNFYGEYYMLKWKKNKNNHRKI